MRPTSLPSSSTAARCSSFASAALSTPKEYQERDQWQLTARIGVFMTLGRHRPLWSQAVGCRSLALGLDPGDDFWPDVCACLATDQYSEMLQPNSNLAWILNDAHTRC